MKTTDLSTPAALIDVARMHANVERMQTSNERAGRGLRPHVKTTKCLPVVRAQLAAGARGITVSTLKEAEQFFAAGVHDILYAVSMAPHKLPQALALRRQGCELKLLIDNTRLRASRRRLRPPARPGVRGVDRDRHRWPPLGGEAGRRPAARGRPRAAPRRDASGRRDGACRLELRSEHARGAGGHRRAGTSGLRARGRASARGRPALPGRQRGLDAHRTVGAPTRRRDRSARRASTSSSTS